MSEALLDRELIEQCILGSNQGVWEQFVHRYSRLIWSSIHKTFKASTYRYSAEDVEDVYSALFLSLLENDFRKLRQFNARNACSFSTWLTVVTVRKTIDQMRQQLTRARVNVLHDDQAAADGIADPTQSMEQRLMEVQSNEKLARSLNSLSGPDREVYDMLFIKGLSPQDAARNMGTSLSSLYTKKHRLIEKLKNSLTGM